jgi:hypothetical protein
MRKISLNLLGFTYTVEIDESTGAMTVLSHRPVGLVEKAKEYVKAEVSNALAEPLSLHVIEGRKAACFGCDQVEQDVENMYCKACGCPKWERSRLQVKWEMPAAKCNLGKWPE